MLCLKNKLLFHISNLFHIRCLYHTYPKNVSATHQATIKYRDCFMMGSYSL